MLSKSAAAAALFLSSPLVPWLLGGGGGVSGVHDAGGEGHEQDGRALLLAEAPPPAHPPPLLEHHLLAEPHRAELHGDLVRLRLLFPLPLGGGGGLLLPLLLLLLLGAAGLVGVEAKRLPSLLPVPDPARVAQRLRRENTQIGADQPKTHRSGAGAGPSAALGFPGNEIGARIGTHHGSAGSPAPERGLGGVALGAGLGLAGGRALVRIRGPAPLLRQKEGTARLGPATTTRTADRARRPRIGAHLLYRGVHLGRHGRRIYHRGTTPLLRLQPLGAPALQRRHSPARIGSSIRWGDDPRRSDLAAGGCGGGGGGVGAEGD
jgi:hypothetical protein